MRLKIKIVVQNLLNPFTGLKKEMSMRMFRLVKRAMKEVTGVDILGTETNCRQAMAKTEFEYECGEYTTTEDKVVSRTT